MTSNEEVKWALEWIDKFNPQNLLKATQILKSLATAKIEGRLVLKEEVFKCDFCGSNDLVCGNEWKEERDKLINDPAFKVPPNSEFKKVQKKQTADQKAFNTLAGLGISPEEIKALLMGGKHDQEKS
jgi:hypothetical protein